MIGSVKESQAAGGDEELTDATAAPSVRKSKCETNLTALNVLLCKEQVREMVDWSLCVCVCVFPNQKILYPHFSSPSCVYDDGRRMV